MLETHFELETKYLIFETQYLIFETQYLVFETQYLIFGTQYLIFETQYYLIFETQYLRLSIWDLIFETWYLRPNIWDPIFETQYMRRLCLRGERMTAVRTLWVHSMSISREHVTCVVNRATNQTHQSVQRIKGLIGTIYKSGKFWKWN